MLWVGVTGGIGSGKSSVTGLLAERGAPVIDLDAISLELTSGPGPAMDAISREFGSDFVDAKGALDRAKMRTLVGQDPDAIKRLEAILHPVILRTSRLRQNAEDEKNDDPGAYGLVEIPLLSEHPVFLGLVDRVLVVDADAAIRLDRVVVRGKQTREQAERFMAMQSSRRDRLSIADDVLLNEGDRDCLKASVMALHDKYIRLALERSSLGNRRTRSGTDDGSGGGEHNQSGSA